MSASAKVLTARARPASRKGGKASSSSPGSGAEVFPKTDYLLLFTVLAMVGFGLLMVYSASFIFAQERFGDGFYFINRQMIFAAAGFLVMAVVSRLDYRIWKRLSWPVLGVSTVLLIAVLVPGVGVTVKGAQRWISAGLFSFQPGEIAKFAFIVFVARQLTVKHDRLDKFTAGVLSNLLFTAPALVLLLFQPDFGTAAIGALIIFSLMFLGGVPLRFLVVLFGLLATAGVFLVLESPYRMQRLTAFLDPWADPGGKGFQILQSLVALHIGEFWGVGLGNGKEKLFYLPEAHNDFIFAVIGEELGFIGLTAVVLVYVYLCYRGFRIAWNVYQSHGDLFGYYLGAGVTLLLGLQGFVNMAVVVGILPTKGLTLPFISYGGSALVINLFCIGILLSLARGPHPAKTAGKETSKRKT